MAVMVIHLCEYTKTHRIVYFKGSEFYIIGIISQYYF